MHKPLLTALILAMLSGCDRRDAEQRKSPEDSAVPLSQEPGWEIKFDAGEQPWESASLKLEEEIIGSTRLVFSRRHIHPFLAEFDRKLSVVNGTDDRTCLSFAKTPSDDHTSRSDTR